MNGEPALANETLTGYHVEQFFYTLILALTSIIEFYKGVMDKNKSNQMHDIAVKHMEEKIGILNEKFGIK